MNDPAGIFDYKIPVQKIASLQSFKDRAGQVINYRHYKSWSEKLLILYHGIGGDSRYLCGLAHELANLGICSVVTPDLSGHGPNAQVRQNHLVRDLEELIVHLKMTHSYSEFFIGGHSLGGALALKIAFSASASWYSGFLALSPMLPIESGILRPEARDWIMTTSDGIEVLFPEALRTGSEVLKYDRDFLNSALPSWPIHRANEASMKKIEIVYGQNDGLLDVVRYQDCFHDWPNVHLTCVNDLHHFGIVMDKRAWNQIAKIFKLAP